MLTVIMIIVVILSDVILSFVMLNVIMLSVINLDVIQQNVAAHLYHFEIVNKIFRFKTKLAKHYITVELSGDMLTVTVIIE
jgi:hypothetical protein